MLGRLTAELTSLITGSGLAAVSAHGSAYLNLPLHGHGTDQSSDSCRMMGVLPTIRVLADRVVGRCALVGPMLEKVALFATCLHSCCRLQCDRTCATMSTKTKIGSGLNSEA